LIPLRTSEGEVTFGDLASLFAPINDVMTVDVSEIELFPLEETAPSDFRCTRKEQQEFLHERAVTEQTDGFSVTYLGHARGVLVAYMTLAMDAIALQTKEKPRNEITLVRFPAMKLAQLAVDERWERRGIGKNMVALAVVLGLQLGQRVGCRYLTVDAKADLVDWYKRQQFKVNRIARKEQDERAEKRGVRAEDLPSSMRFDLHAALQDLQDRYPSDFPKDAG
jgi:hypothetical protein